MLSSSENMLDAVPLLMLTECLEQCRNNESCSSVNYETGLCVLFSTQADKLPGTVRQIYKILPVMLESAWKWKTCDYKHSLLLPPLTTWIIIKSVNIETCETCWFIKDFKSKSIKNSMKKKIIFVTRVFLPSSLIVLIIFTSIAFHFNIDDEINRSNLKSIASHYHLRAIFGFEESSNRVENNRRAFRLVTVSGIAISEVLDQDWMSWAVFEINDVKLTSLFFCFLPSGALMKSQFPVFTIYAQKVCLKQQPCERAWSIDRVQGYSLKNHIKRSSTATSRQDCYELCFAETDFLCRWAIIND